MHVGSRCGHNRRRHRLLYTRVERTVTASTRQSLNVRDVTFAVTIVTAATATAAAAAAAAAAAGTHAGHVLFIELHISCVECRHLTGKNEGFEVKQ